MAEEDSLEAAKADVDAATGCRSRTRSPSSDFGSRLPGQNQGGVGRVAGQNNPASKRAMAELQQRLEQMMIGIHIHFLGYPVFASVSACPTAAAKKITFFTGYSLRRTAGTQLSAWEENGESYSVHWRGRARLREIE